MEVGDAIRKPASIVEPETTVSAAAELMDRAGVGALLVVDSGTLVGIVTDRDLVVRGLARRVDPGARIDALMTTSPVSIDATADLRDALGIFRSHPFRRLPVLDGDRVVGMLSVDDLVVDLAADLADLVRPITGQVLFAAPAPAPPATLA